MLNISIWMLGPHSTVHFSSSILDHFRLTVAYIYIFTMYFLLLLLLLYVHEEMRVIFTHAKNYAEITIDSIHCSLLSTSIR